MTGLASGSRWSVTGSALSLPRPWKKGKYLESMPAISGGAAFCRDWNAVFCVEMV